MTINDRRRARRSSPETERTSTATVALALCGSAGDLQYGTSLAPETQRQNERKLASRAGHAMLPLLSLAACVWLTGCDSLAVMREPDPAVRYIAFGDSTTAGPSTRDYPELLVERRNEPTDAISNEGKGGERTDDGLDRLRMILDDGLFPSATVLLYWQGGNDLNAFIKGVDPLLLFSPDAADFPFATELSNALADVRTNVEEAVRLGRGAGLDVFVATYFPLAQGVAECNPLPFDILLPVQADSGNAYLSALNETLRTAAANSGALVVDIETLGEVLLSDPENYFNCNHLSAVGNELVAARFDAALGSPPTPQGSLPASQGKKIPGR